MNAELLAVMDFWEREKGISRDVLITAVQESLVQAAKKAVGPARELRVEIDPKNGDIRAYAKQVVAERVISKHDQISVFDARRIKADAQIGEELEVEVTPTGFGRIAGRTVGFVANQAQTPETLGGLILLMSVVPAALGIVSIIIVPVTAMP